MCVQRLVCQDLCCLSGSFHPCTAGLGRVPAQESIAASFGRGKSRQLAAIGRRQCGFTAGTAVCIQLERHFFGI